jgi:alkyl hydroperoxide reductase subunit AhpC
VIRRSAVAGKYQQLEAMNVEVIAISKGSIFSHIMFKRTSPGDGSGCRRAPVVAVF